jgi:hypothetical protein
MEASAWRRPDEVWADTTSLTILALSQLWQSKSLSGTTLAGRDAALPMKDSE